MDAQNLTSVGSSYSQLAQVSFSWYDYILFIVMLVISALIGIYFGCFGSKQSTANEYLMGGKTMKVLPIAISLVASHTSGLTLLALPADVYRYGAGYWLGSFSMILLCAITIYIYLPVFFNLQITSTYEYLERRFDKRARTFASFLYLVSVLLYLPIVVYIPALAFSAATGVGVEIITPIVCAICVFYTTIGGLKAVVWTDTLQFTVTVGAVITVFILGSNAAGGFKEVWDKTIESGRLDVFDFDIDPTKRESFWIIIIGLTMHWVGHTSINQSCIQKFLAVPTLKDSIIAVVYFGIGMNILKTACVLTGFVMYAKYWDCDPLSSKQIESNDQLLPYYVMDVAKNLPGLSGLFIAGVFSAALSTMSATLNCVAATIYEDFIKKILGKASEKTVSNILKLTVVAVGGFSTAMVFVIRHMGGMFPLAISLGGVTNGALLGMFTLGLVFPRANGKGAFYGAVVSLLALSAIAFPAKYYQSQGFIKYPPKPLATNGCDFEISNVTILGNYSKAQLSEPNVVFKISHYYYTLYGTMVCMGVGLIVSYLTNKNDAPVDKNLISPISRFLLPAPSRGDYDLVDNEQINLRQ